MSLILSNCTYLKHLLPNIYHAFIKSQAWVAFCFALLCKYVQLINDWNQDSLVFISFFATIFVYNFSHWIGDKASLRIPIIVITVLICFGIGVLYLDFSLFIILSLLAGISILYSWSFNPKTLRNMPRLKIFWIALVWTLVVIMPAFSTFQRLNNNLIWLAISIFCFTLAITIPFDIRDLSTDDENLKTLPQLVGIQRSIFLSLCLIFLSAFFMLTYFSYQVDVGTRAFLMSLSFATIILLMSRNSFNKWFTTFWVEGLSALPFVFYFILK